MGVGNWNSPRYGKWYTETGNHSRRYRIDPGMVDGFIWPNEYDTSGDPNWAADETKFATAEYAAVKNDPIVHDRPVIGPSFVNLDSPEIVGNQSGSLDTGGIHPYTQCESPTPQHDESEIARAGITAPGKAVWATKLGTPQRSIDQRNAPLLRDSTSGVRRSNVSAALHRWHRTNLHVRTMRGRFWDPGLASSEDHFGLLRSDYSEKPAFVAIKNLIRIVGYGSPMRITPLQMSLSGDTAGDLQHLVLQKANGSYIVALWRTASIWDRDARTGIYVPRKRSRLGWQMPSRSRQQIRSSAPRPRIRA